MDIMCECYAAYVLHVWCLIHFKQEKTAERGILSPGDIYKHFVQQTPPSSILKSPSVEFPAAEPIVEKPHYTVVHSTLDVSTVQCK